ncbi:MAG: amino acid adenylation domain-containing protein [bacterium]|nr:amino acid adenylation domain-containing protein [bacterium]
MGQPVSLDDIFARSGLTSAQLAIWFAQKLRPDAPMYNMGSFLLLPPDMSPAHFEQALDAMVQRADAFRTVVREEDGVPQPVVLPAIDYTVEHLDFTSESDPVAALEAWGLEQVHRPYNLAQRLFNMALARIGDDRYVWFIGQHHLITDGVTMDILADRLVAFAALARDGRLDTAPAFPSYADYAAFECSQRRAARERADEVPSTSGGDEPLPPLVFYGREADRDSTETARLAVELGEDRAQALLRLADDPRVTAKTRHASLFNILAAVLFAYLHRVSGNCRLSVGSMHHNRKDPRFRDTVGMFVGALPLQVSVDDGETFLSLIDKVREDALASRRSAPGVVMARQQDHAYDVVINYQVADIIDTLDTPMQTKWVYCGHGVEVLALQVLRFGQANRFRLLLDFGCDVFPETQRPRARDHFLTLLDAALADPANLVAEAPIMPAAERALTLDEWNRTEAPYPDRTTVSDLIARQAERRPDAVAVSCDGVSLTYRELDARANQLAHYLQGLGVKPEGITAICVEKSVEMVTTTLATLKAGGAYLPLDPAYPPDRLAYMLEDSGARVLLTMSHLADRFPDTGAETVCIDTDWDRIEQMRPDAVEDGPTPGSLAYMIYTSGSTGRPKGALIEHRGLCNMMKALIHGFAISEDSVVLQFASFSFDMSVSDIFTALGAGARLCVVPQETVSSLSDLKRLMKEEEATVVVLPPAMLRLLDPDEFPSVRTVVSAGERCPVDVANRWLGRCRFLNGYGPTETTACATLAHCTEHLDEAPPIGRPIANVRTYVLDANGQPTPIGVPGEMYIGGAGVGRGYLNQPELTAERFLPDPFAATPGARMYRTGDLVRYRDSGVIEFLGRTDDQVKVHGHRIELGEIETALDLHPGVKASAVVPRRDNGHHRLVGYIVADSDGDLSPEALRGHLYDRLPTHMVPRQFVFIDALPLTDNGKVDREALPEPESNGNGTGADSRDAHPRTFTEERLATIWRDVLRIDALGVHDSVFDLGADSLAVIQAVDMARHAGLSLDPRDVYHWPTVAGLAAAVDGARTADVHLVPGGAEYPAVVPIKPSGTKPALFCIAPLGGVTFPYYNLLPHFDEDRPLYALQDPGLEDGVPSPESMNELAVYYIEAMRSIQPEGPYLIGGWSFGGLVAFEMACQLEAAGHEVALLALMDTGSVSQNRKANGWLREYSDALKMTAMITFWVFRHGGPYIRDGVYLLLSPFRKKKAGSGPRPSFGEYIRWAWLDVLQRFFLKEAGVAQALPKDSELLKVRQPTIRKIINVSTANAKALRRYVPQQYDGKVTLFKAKNQPIKTRVTSDATMGWGELTSQPVDIRPIDGNHVVIFREPYIRSFAEALRTCVDEISAPSDEAETTGVHEDGAALSRAVPD